MLVVACFAMTSASCRGCEDEEEKEERAREREHYWRVGIRIVGSGRVATFVDAFDCRSDGTVQSGECGPKLVTFKELRPASLQATPADGWTLDRWTSEIREPDGAMTTRKGPMPDGRVYLNGFGYADTGELETVTAIFVRAAPRDGGD